MGKFNITESEKKSIRRMYGILTEDVKLPTIVSGTYTASNCDELHAFQSTGGKVIGNMNVLVGNKLDEIYKSGINPKPTKVNVKVNGMTVTWSVIIEESQDGKSWIGFTSRGAGCNNDVYNRAESSSQGNDINTAKQKIMTTFNENNIEIEVVNDFVYKNQQTGFRQIFYTYTKPSKYPSIGGQQLNKKQNNSTTWFSSASNPDELNVKFKTWIKDNLEGSLWNVEETELYQSGDEIGIKTKIYEDKNGYRTFSILFNPKGFPQESKNNALTKNPGSKIITDGIVTFNGKDFEYHLIGLK